MPSSVIKCTRMRQNGAAENKCLLMMVDAEDENEAKRNRDYSANITLTNAFLSDAVHSRETENAWKGFSGTESKE